VVSFTPHLVPANRGILSTCYASLAAMMSREELLALYREQYANEPFVRVLPAGQLPNISQVRGSNFCDIGLEVDSRTGRVVVVAAIDNLVKGAAGQAVQNMNLMLGFEESAGLTALGVFP
jgi:N-acetyl-gamma-glutamyl-phosphate reductase